MPKSRQFKRFLPPKPEMQQLTRLLLQFYVTIFGHFRGKSQKIWFYKALDRKNSSISSPDRIFNSWRGFYCIFKWQYFGILREEAKIENCKLVNRPWWGQTIQQSTLYFKLKPFLAWTLVSYRLNIQGKSHYALSFFLSAGGKNLSICDKTKGGPKSRFCSCQAEGLAGKNLDFGPPFVFSANTLIFSTRRPF